MKNSLSLLAILMVAMTLGTASAQADEIQASFVVIGSEGSTPNGQDASYLVNGVTTDKWCVTSFSAGSAKVILMSYDDSTYKPTKYWFYTGNDVNYNGDGYRNPTAWTLEGSNDGSTWTALDTQTGQTLPTTNSTKTDEYSVSVSEYYRYFRLTINGIGGSDCMELGEFQMMAEAEVGDDYVPLTLDSSNGKTNTGQDASYLVNDITTDKWCVIDYSADNKAWTVMKSAEGYSYKPTKYWFHIGNDVNYRNSGIKENGWRNPTAWTLEASNDGSSWVTLDQQTNQTLPYFMMSMKTDEYSVSASEYYTYFRLTIDGITGGQCMELGEFRMAA